MWNTTIFWPLGFTKFSLYSFVLFANFGKAHTICHSIKKLEGVSSLSCWQFSNFELLNFQTKNWPSHLKCHIYPNTWSVRRTHCNNLTWVNTLIASVIIVIHYENSHKLQSDLNTSVLWITLTVNHSFIHS